MRAFFLAGLAALLGAVPARAADPSPVPSPTPAAAPTPAPIVPLGEIASRSQAAVAALEAVQPTGRADPAAATREMLPELATRIEALLAETGRAGTLAGASLDALRDRESAWAKIADTLGRRGELLFASARGLAADDVQVAQARALWRATAQAAREANAPTETSAAASAVLAAADAAAGRVKAGRDAILGLQSRVGELQAKVRAARSAVDAARASAVCTLFERDSPPLWDEVARLGDDARAENDRQTAGQNAALTAYVLQNWTVFAQHGAIFLALLAFFRWLRGATERWTRSDPTLKEALPAFQLPAAAAMALSFLAQGPIYGDAPLLLRAVLGALLLLPTLVLVRRLIDPRLHRVPLALAAFYLLDQAQVALAGFPRLNRLVFAAQMVGAAVTFAWLARSARTLDTPAPAEGDAPAHPVAARWLPPLMGLAALLCVAAFTAGTLGYTRLGRLLGATTLRSCYLGVIFAAALLILRGLLIVALRVRPASSLRLVREHRALVERRIRRLLGWLAIATCGWITLQLFGLGTPLAAAVGGLLAWPLSSGADPLTPGHLVGFVAAIWLSVLVSRAVRFLLDEEIYHRLHLAPGLPYAISAMVNYGVLLVGFIVALNLLGVDLTKVTIIASAFSVGLGFGLQNVINNFVSGIILLFERPVRRGDIVQLGDTSGEVRQIGIRASIIRTPDGADLIVPNGNLISNPVINWTYSDRGRAVEVPLTVLATPAESARVIEVALACAREAAADAGVSHPPEAFITGFSAGKLTLVVRAWARVYQDSTRLRSDLASALFAGLARENIEIV